MLTGLKTRHYIGRQAPVKRCLARFAELAHAAGALGAGKMTLAGMGAHDFSACGDFETLGGAAMCFQFLFWLLRISRHYKNPLCVLTGSPLTESPAHYNLLEWGAAVLRPY